MAFGISTPSIGGNLFNIPSGSTTAPTGQQTAYILTPELQRIIQDIKADRWNKLFTYSFSILKASSDGSVNPTGTVVVPGFIRNVADFRIPPSSLSVSTQFASGVTATNRGILEENNGVVFRTITIQGTTGLFPDRLVTGQGETPTPVIKVLKNLFPGTASAINNVIDQAQSVIDSVVGPDSTRDLSPPDSPTSIELQQTGYFKFWELNNFIIAYSELKKKPVGEDFRLVFNSPKDNISYICTPMAFDLRRDSSSPLLYKYNIVLRVWDIATFGQADPLDVLDGIPRPENVSATKALTETLRASRQTINAAKNAIAGVHSDINSILNVYTQAVLLLKDTVGLAEEIADFPEVFRNNARALLQGPTNSFVASLNSFGGTSIGSIDERESDFPGSSNASSIVDAGGDATKASTTPDGETDLTPKSNNAIVGVGTFENLIDDPEFGAQSLDDFDDIPDPVQSQIDNARDVALNLNSGDIRDLESSLQEIADNLAESVGGGDADYNEAFNLPPPIETDREPTEDDILTLVAIQESRCSFQASLGTGEFYDERELDPFVQSNEALDLEDQMVSPLSAIPVAFERGGSLELLAQKFLGDPNRAREIAVLNNLRPPFVDESGFTRDIENANGRTFVVDDRENLAINEVVILQGTGVVNSRRRILDIDDIGGGQFRIAVDGPDNIALFAPGTNPFIFARIPGTVGPGDTLLIPSLNSPAEATATRPSSLQDRLSFAERIFKIDLKLDDNGRDLIVNPTADIGRAFGYDNALQALRTAVEVQQNELEQHPQFGLAVPIGGRNSDTPITTIKEIIQTTILTNPRFADAIVEVEINGSVSRIRIDAEGAAGTGQLPVEFEVGRG